MIALLAVIVITVWVYYLAMCTLKRANKAGTLPKPLRPLAYLLLALFLVVDCVFNLVLGTVFFLQLPRQWLFTARCEMNMKRTDWRAKEARFWCVTMLDPFDPSGRHCS